MLAIIAYKQPCSKTEVDKIRGVDSSHIVRGLMDKRLVKVCGRSDEVGRPTQYGTTQEFLEVFNLPDISSLPAEHELEEMANANEVGMISDIKNICFGNKEQFNFDEIEELDILSEEIKAISIETDFTKSLKTEEKAKLDTTREFSRTAFEILEEFVQKKIVSDSNMLASDSGLFTAVTDPSVVNNLLSVDLNTPDLCDDDFEMIDLETGEKILEDNVAVAAKDLIAAEDLEACALSAALDKAFSELTGESLVDELPARLSEDKQKELEGELGEDSQIIENIESIAQSLKNITQETVEKGKDLDIDLTFLNESPLESSDFDENSTSSDEER